MNRQITRLAAASAMPLPIPGRHRAVLLQIACAAGLALLATASPALAHHGVKHDGCPTGQSFAKGDITVTGAFTRATPPAAQAAGGYFTIANSGSEPDTLDSVTTAAANTTGLHEMKMTGDIMEMAPVEGGLAIPPGGTLQLMPRGYHLMLVGLAHPFREGECVQVTLHFARAGDLEVMLNVGGLAQQTPPGSDGEPGMDGMSHDDHAMSHDMSDMSGMSMN